MQVHAAARMRACVLCSLADSFQCPGPAYFHHCSLLSSTYSMRPQLSSMSPVVRQLLPTSVDQVAGSSTPHSHIEKSMGRPVAFSASRMGG